MYALELLFALELLLTIPLCFDLSHKVVEIEGGGGRRRGERLRCCWRYNRERDEHEPGGINHGIIVIGLVKLQSEIDMIEICLTERGHCGIGYGRMLRRVVGGEFNESGKGGRKNKVRGICLVFITWAIGGLDVQLHMPPNVLAGLQTSRECSKDEPNPMDVITSEPYDAYMSFKPTTSAWHNDSSQVTKKY